MATPVETGQFDALPVAPEPGAPDAAAPVAGATDPAAADPSGGAPAPAGWYPDPLGADRSRRWDGGGWTAAVRSPPPQPPPGGRRARRAKETTPPPVDGISWVPWLSDLTAPEPAARRSRRRRPGVLAVAAGALVLLVAAVASGAILPGEDQRPVLDREISYEDPAAGFGLRYPEAWEVLRRDEGEGIRFAVAARGASAADTNTVSVAVGATSAPLPPLHTLADELTEKLRSELPGVELLLAEQSRVAGAPALRFTFRDSSTSTTTRIEQWVGRTAAGRPLTITVTVREPRTAPGDRELADFVASVTSP